MNVDLEDIYEVDSRVAQTNDMIELNRMEGGAPKTTPKVVEQPKKRVTTNTIILIIAAIVVAIIIIMGVVMITKYFKTPVKPPHKERKVHFRPSRKVKLEPISEGKKSKSEVTQRLMERHQRARRRKAPVEKQPAHSSMMETVSAGDVDNDEQEATMSRFSEDLDKYNKILSGGDAGITSSEDESVESDHDDNYYD